MSTAETPQLYVVEGHAEPVVDDVAGIIMPDDPRWEMAYRLREKEEALRLVERDLRAKRRLIADLRIQREDEAKKARELHPERAKIERVFERWRTRSGHVRAKLTPERFDWTADRLREGYEECDLHMAIEGLLARTFVDTSGVRHDGYKVVMKSGDQVERYANLCPPGLRRELRRPGA